MRAFLKHWSGLGVTAFTMLCFFCTTVWSPQAAAAQGAYWPVWRTAYIGGAMAQDWPDDDWQDVAVATLNQDGSRPDITTNTDEQWILNGDTNAGILGLNSFQAGNFVQRAANRAPIIFAQYFAEQAQLRVYVVRVRQTDVRTIRVQKADWTPWNGMLYARDRYFLTDYEAVNPIIPGHDPFVPFRDADNDRTDPVFYNISFAAAQVAVGNAMQHFQAAMAFMAVPQLRLDQNTKTSGGFLRKTITTTTKGYARPIWFVGLPPSAQPYGSVAQICAITYGDGKTCDDPKHLVSSGVSFTQWKGGTMPDVEDLLFTNTETQHSWSVFAFALLTVALAAISAGALGAAMAAVGAAAGTVGGTATGIGAGTIAAVSAGAGVTYTAASAIANGGSLNSMQNGYLGETGSGTTSASASNSTYEKQLRDVTQKKVIDVVDPSEALSGIAENFGGSCGTTARYQDCVSSGKAPGMIPRSDDSAEPSRVANSEARYKLCKNAGYILSTLELCAAGKILTPAESQAYTSSGNVVTDQSDLAPTDTNSDPAATSYYGNKPPAR